MKSQKLIYARVKIHNPPIGKRLYITKDCKQIFYYNQQEKVHVYNNETYEIKQEFDFIKTKLVSEGTNGWYKILLDIDIDKINIVLRQPYNINGRKHLFCIFKKCYDETTNNYISHLILNLYEDILIKRKNENDFLNWFIKKELSDVTYKFMPSNIYKVGTIYIDLLKGQFLKNSDMRNVLFNGGMIYDMTYSWIDKIINCMELAPKNHKMEISFMYTNCTLIICDKTMCTYWMNKLKTTNCNHSIRIINTAKDHKNILYNDLITLDYLIINSDYLINKKYISIIDEYNINGGTLREILNIIKEEFQSFDNIKNKNDVILSLINWNRIVIDHLSINNFIKDTFAFELLMTLQSQKKWIQIDEFPTIHNDYMNIFKFLLGCNDITFPLYENSKVIYINNIMYAFDDNKNDNINIKEKSALIKSGKLEIGVQNYINKLKLVNINKFCEIMNALYETTISRQTYVNMMDKINMAVEFDNLECSICFGTFTQEETLFTECGHHYCIGCILENLEYNNNCPMCRNELSIKNLHYVDDNCSNDKANELLKIMNVANNKTYIYINLLKHKKYLLNYLKNFRMCNNIEWLHSDMSKNQLLINNETNNKIDIIFYDMCENIDEIKKHLKLKKFKKINMHYLFYDILQDKFKQK